MQIILLEDVKSLGKKGEIVSVSDGYAKNFILPKKLGVEASSANLNTLKLQKANEEKLAAERLAEAREFAALIESKTLQLTIKVGEGGKIFGAISTKEISQAAKSQCDLELDKKKIVLANPIKTMGNHEVTIKVHPKVTATLKLVVTQA